ncbi:hypothetical protein DY000_02031171 [Brassica cretica]|uniref:Uncharacterized protein n=1 Tax=Brassica cretica TaxID=69181 RepID=A0ABQ7DFT7_BRACR|nr:hypothetical protein DY000_02031171 [Brassica cretica]
MGEDWSIRPFGYSFPGSMYPDVCTVIVELVGDDELQVGEFGRLVVDLAEAPFRMYAGQSGTWHYQSVRYGQKSEPRLKYSERPNLHAGLVSRTDPQTGAHHLVSWEVLRTLASSMARPYYSMISSFM